MIPVLAALVVLLNTAVAGHRTRATTLNHRVPNGSVIPNHNPLFERGPDVWVTEDSGIYPPTPWALNVVDGDGPLDAMGRPTDSGRQSVAFTTTTTETTLFAGPLGLPRIADDGLLTFTPAADECGVAKVTAQLSDDGISDCIPGANAPCPCQPTDCRVSIDVIFYITIICVNDPPSFRNLGDQVVSEDSGKVVVTAWAYDIEKGAGAKQTTTSPSELSQNLEFTVTNDNNALFSEQPRVTWRAGSPKVADLSFTPRPGACGRATATVGLKDSGGTANGGIDVAIPATQFTITVECMNDKPSFRCGQEVVVLEDAGSVAVPNWAKGISSGDSLLSSAPTAAGDGLAFTLHYVNPDDSRLFSRQPSIDRSTGELTFETKPDANTRNGAVEMYVQLQDSAGAVSCSPISSCCKLRIAVTPVNDPPSFACGPDIEVCEDLVNLPVAPTPPIYTDGNGWVKMMDVGAANEGVGSGNEGQRLVFTVETDKAALFAKGPAIDEAGTLTFELNPDANGIAGVRVHLRDTGDSTPPGSNKAPSCEFSITVHPVADAPSFVIPMTTELSAREDDPPTATTWAGFVSHVSRGPSDESGQFASFTVDTDNPSLFKVGPKVDMETATEGRLSFELAPDACGTTTLGLVLRDDGDVSSCGAKGGNTARRSHVLKVACVNDPPVFALSCSQCNITVCEDEASKDKGGYSLAGMTEDVLPGPVDRHDEAGQEVHFTVTTDNDKLFDDLPSLSPAGVFRFSTAQDAHGEARITVVAVDTGSPPKKSPKQYFYIRVTPANDPPSFEVKGDLLVVECRGEYGAGCAVPPTAMGCTRFFPAWVHNVRPGVSRPTFSEDSQSVSFEVVVDQAVADYYFATLPVVNASTGTLSFTTKTGVSTVEPIVLNIVAQDSSAGDRQCGGMGITTKQVKLTIQPVNWPPCFVCGGDVTVLEDAGSVVRVDHARNITAGPYDEHLKLPKFTLTPARTALFSKPPALDSAGALSFTTAENMCGSTVVHVLLDDGHPTDNSATCSFTITIVPVNDQPSFRHIGDVMVNEDSARSCVQWVKSASPGPEEHRPDGSCAQQTMSFEIDVQAPLDPVSKLPLFAEQPTVDAASGLLCFRPSDNMCGATTVGAVLKDNGGTANGGIDTSERTSFQITITCINDAPYFVRGLPIAVCEDTGPRVYPGWCSGQVPGPAVNEDYPMHPLRQEMAFSTVVDRPELFVVPPQVDSVTCSLLFTPAKNAYGIAQVGIDLCDNSDNSPPHRNCAKRETISVTIHPVNDPPSFTKGGDITVLEDSPRFLAPRWATRITKGGGGLTTAGSEEEQTLSFIVTPSKPELFREPPLVDPFTGDLTFALAPDANGRADVTVCLRDDGGVGAAAPQNLTGTIGPAACSGGVDTFCESMYITVVPCNDPPRFTGASTVEVAEDSGATTIAAWLEGISTGPPDEWTQKFISASMTVPEDKKYLFASLPVVSVVTGDLSFQPAPNRWGDTTITFVIRDDGGVEGEGCRDTVRGEFVLRILPVNDHPTFFPGGDVSVAEDSPLYLKPWASGISAGPFETDQTLVFRTTAHQPSLFAEQPTVSPEGVLRFLTAPNAFGSTTVEVQLEDGGGDFARSPVSRFKIDIRPVNDPPTFRPGKDISTLEDSPAHCEPAWVQDVAPGPDNERGQRVTFELRPRCCADMLTGTPTLDPSSGELCFTTAPNAFGSVVVDIIAKDTGGTLDQGVDVSSPQAFTIHIAPVNDPPHFLKGPDITILEDSPPQTRNSWAGNVTAGPFEDPAEGRAGQSVVFTAMTTPLDMFTKAPQVQINGDLSFHVAPDANGEASVELVLTDNGGIDNGGRNSWGTTFVVTVLPVNDPPSFTPGANIEVNEDSPPVQVLGWASSIRAGPPDEMGQGVTFIATAAVRGLFSVQPAIVMPGGSLHFTLLPNANGATAVTVVAQDNGGTEHGGRDSSDPVTFQIRVIPVNDPPFYTPGPSVTVVMDSQPYASTWASGIAGGPPNEPQEVSFRVGVGDPSLFTPTGFPTIDGRGVLRFTPASGVTGTTTATVTAMDTEGLTAPPSTFQITIVAPPPTVLRAILLTSYEAFSAPTFQNIVSSLYAIPPNRVVIVATEPGSVTVDFFILDDADPNAPSSKLVTDRILHDAVDTDSPLRTRLQLLEVYPNGPNRDTMALKEDGGGGGGTLRGVWIGVTVVLSVLLVAFIGCLVWWYRRRRQSSAVPDVVAYGGHPAVRKELSYQAPQPSAPPWVNPIATVFDDFAKPGKDIVVIDDYNNNAEEEQEVVVEEEGEEAEFAGDETIVLEESPSGRETTDPTPFPPPPPPPPPFPSLPVPLGA